MYRHGIILIASVIAVFSFGADRVDAGKPSQKDVGNFNNSKRYAFIVGIGDYENIKKLPCTQRDAEELATELRNLNFTDVVTVINPRTKQDILKSLATYVTRIGELKEYDTFLFFYSGHGAMMVTTMTGYDGKVRSSEMSCIVPAAFKYFGGDDATSGGATSNSIRSDKSPGMEEQLVTLSELYNLIDDVTKGGRRIVILDACRTDPKQTQQTVSETKTTVEGRAVVQIKGVNETRFQFGEAEAIPDSYAIMRSCSKNEKSWEDPTLAGGHGFFTYNLLRYLRGHDRANSGAYLTLANMQTFTRTSTAATVQGLFDRGVVDTTQNPMLKYGDFGGEEWVLGDLTFNKQFRGKDLRTDWKFTQLLNSGKIQSYDLTGCNISGLKLEGIVIRDSLFVGVTADGTSFRESAVWNVNFANASLNHADFSGSDVTNSRFIDVDWSTAYFYKAEGVDAAFIGGSTSKTAMLGVD